MDQASALIKAHSGFLGVEVKPDTGVRCSTVYLGVVPTGTATLSDINEIVGRLAYVCKRIGQAEPACMSVRGGSLQCGTVTIGSYAPDDTRKIVIVVYPSWAAAKSRQGSDMEKTTFRLDEVPDLRRLAA